MTTDENAEQMMKMMKAQKAMKRQLGNCTSSFFHCVFFVLHLLMLSCFPSYVISFFLARLLSPPFVLFANVRRKLEEDRGFCGQATVNL